MQSGWNEEEISTTAKHIKIVSLINDASLGEIAFYNSDSKKIDKNTLRLVDEYIRELNFIK